MKFLLKILGGGYFFTIKIEHHRPYFDTLTKLTGIRDFYNGSFIAEHMLIVSKYMRMLIYDIMQKKELSGKTFYEKILQAIEIRELPACGFSEFETYGNYVMRHYPHAYKGRKLRTCRQGSLFLCENPSKEMLDWAAKDYDVISLEGNERKFEPMVFLTQFQLVRKAIRMKKMVLFRRKIRNIYGSIRNKKYIDFE